MAILEQVQDDVKTAMKAGEKEKVQALRLVIAELQRAAKEGNDDAVSYTHLTLPTNREV